MKKLMTIVIIILLVVVIAMVTSLSFAWFVNEEKMISTILHQSNSPSANVVVENITQSGSLIPAEPVIDNNGVPSYASDPTGYEAYVASSGFLTADGIYLAKAATLVTIEGRFKYEGKDDQGGTVGTRTLVVQLQAHNQEAQIVSLANFGFMLEADDDDDDQTPPSITRDDFDRTTYKTYSDVFTISVVPAALSTDWYYFDFSIYLSNIDDRMSSSLNGMTLDFTLNIIAA